MQAVFNAMQRVAQILDLHPKLCIMYYVATTDLGFSRIENNE